MGLDTVELVMAFEESFHLEIPNATAAQMLTPADVIDFHEAAVRQRPEDPIRPLVAEIVRLLTIRKLSLKPAKYREDARFVQDMGAD